MADQVINLNQGPYYDDYDPSKGFTHIVALPGRVEQAREFTQLQTMLLDFLKRLGNIITRNGTIQEGCIISVSGTTATISSGSIYYDGIVFNVPQSTLTIAGVGKEVVGVSKVQTLITETNDTSLLDPAQDEDNYQQPGAYRVKTVLQYTLNDSSSAPVYTLQDGALVIDPPKPELSIITDTLAQRMYDEAGNYVVKGMTLSTSDKDSTHVSLTVNSGKAYVLGYLVNKPTGVIVSMDKALDTRAVTGEPKTYATGTNSYPLTNNPVNTVTRVQATVQTSSSITRGSTSLDPLPDSPVSSIVSVVQGATTYVQGTDYQLSGNSIQWLTAGPTVGSTYTATYQYVDQMIAGTDYNVTSSGSDPSITYSITFTGTGVLPVNNTTIYIDYTFFLSRKDLVAVDKDGNIKVIKGQSDIQANVAAPVLVDDSLLALGTVFLYPNSPTTKVNSYAIARMSMGDLQSLYGQVKNLQYNQALTNLDQQAQSGRDPATLKGIFTDGFYGITKSDVNHSAFNIAFDFQQGAVYLPTSSAAANQPSVDVVNSTAKIYGRIATAPVTEVIGAQQIYATDQLLVNPYNVYNNQGHMEVSPSVDNWIDTSTIVVQNSSTTVYHIHRWWYHGGTFYNDTEKYLYDNLKLTNGSTWGGWNNVTGTLSTSSQAIMDDAIMYMRQKTVAVTLRNLTPNAQNLVASFNGIAVNLNPVSPTVAGTTTGSVNADATGYAQATFTIPPNVPCGTVEISISNATDQAVGYYTAFGRKRVVEDIVNTTFVTAIPQDPLAESFMFTQDQILTSVGLFFSAKDPMVNAKIQIRDMINGYPGTTVYAEKVITPTSITVSTDGTVETKVTFDNPVLCKANTQYCFVIETHSPNYQVWVGTLGKSDVKTGASVVTQPYLNGTLFTSANGLTWSASQTQDAKFNLYVGQYQSTGTIQFQPITGLSTDRILLMADYLTPTNTGCTWSVQLDSGGWVPISTYVDKDLSSTTSSITLKATFAASTYMSPLIALDSFTLVSFLTAQSGSYVSLNTTFSQSFTTITQIFTAYVPSGCSIVPQFATDGTGTTWTTGTQSGSAVDQGNGYYQYTYTYTLGTAATNFRARLNITAPNSLVRPVAKSFMNILT